MKIKKLKILLIVGAFCLPLLSTPSARGCDAYVLCSVKVYGPDGKTVKSMGYNRKVDGKGKNCAIFGWFCSRCEVKREKSYYLDWCKDQYKKTAKKLCKSNCPYSGADMYYKIGVEVRDSTEHFVGSISKKHVKCD